MRVKNKSKKNAETKERTREREIWNMIRHGPRPRPKIFIMKANESIRKSAIIEVRTLFIERAQRSSPTL